MNNLPQITPQQDAAVTIAINDLIAQRYAILKCGRRSGTSIMLWELVKRAGYRNVYVLTRTHSDYVTLIPDNVQIIFRLEDLPADGLVVILEPMQMSDSYALFIRAKDKGFPVFVIGSNGPHYTEEWKARGGQSYSAWELSSVTRESLDRIYKEDPERAARDYEAF